MIPACAHTLHSTHGVLELPQPLLAPSTQSPPPLGLLCLPAPSQQQHLCPTQPFEQELPYHLLDDEGTHEGILICREKGEL